MELARAKEGKPVKILCKLGRHRYDYTDQHGRSWCIRCEKRKPVVYTTRPDPDLAGRQLTRPKTRKQA